VTCCHVSSKGVEVFKQQTHPQEGT
jgi:hypothetical protein